MATRKKYVDDQPVHTMFGLTYAGYFTVPRATLQHMPVEWQRKFVKLVSELPITPTYQVQRRDERGKFIKDPFARYKYGQFTIHNGEFVEETHEVVQARHEEWRTKMLAEREKLLKEKIDEPSEFQHHPRVSDSPDGSPERG